MQSDMTKVKQGTDLTQTENGSNIAFYSSGK
jgi:hypothetical protein